MRILVTGATGFVGRALCRRLGAEGHEVWGLARTPQAAVARGGIARAFPWDGLAGPPPPEAFEGVGAVVHLAGEPVAGRWTARKRRAIRESRVEGTRALVAGMRAAAAAPRLVSASAIGYYGDRGDEELREDAPAGAGFLAEVCQGWEEAALEARAAGAEVTRVRIGIVLGPGGGALERMLPIYRRGLGGRLGSGRQWWSWILLDDLAALLAWAATSPAPPPPVMNAAAPEPRRQAEVARALADALGRRLFLPAPAFALRAALGGFSEELLTSKRCLPEATLGAGFAFRHPALEGALGELLGGRP